MSEYTQVKFTGEALEDFKRAFPDLPPGDEIMVKVRIGPCSHCGNDLVNEELSGMDVDGITEDGEVFGSVICGSCMEAGL